MLWFSPSKKRIHTAVSSGLILVMLYVNAAYAASTAYSAMDMIVNIAQQMPNLMRMVTAIGYVMGFYFIFFAILKLKQYGEMRTMMASHHSLKAPLVYLVVGGMLIYLPSSVHVLTSTFWGTPSPLGYEGASDTDQWSTLMNACILVVQLFGVIAFMRGLVMLTQLAGHGGQPGAFGKALTHIVGGIFCINLYAFIKVVLATLGLSL